MKMKTPHQKETLDELAGELLNTRDLCGNERRYILDWELDNFKLSAEQWLYVVSEVDRHWNEFRRLAGVKRASK